MHFTKMQGIGNDYIYFNCFETEIDNPNELSKRLSDRHFSIGGDGIVLIMPSEKCDFRMRMFNADGSEGNMCGNATRCIGKYVYERGLTDKTELTLMTRAGLKQLQLRARGGKVHSVRVDMGSPELDPRRVPVDLPGEIVLGHRLDVGGMLYAIHCVSMGNPHCVIFVRDPDDVDLPMVGPLIENHRIFPNRTNVEFVTVRDRQHLRMRVWERGAGETLACGTGACAALVASVLTGKADREAEVRLNGGVLQIAWSPEDNHVYKEGPAEFVFDGEWPEA